MTSTNLLSVWDDPKNVDLLTSMHREGKTFADIAHAIGQGVTRNAAIGKAKRLKLPPREGRHAQSRFTARTINGEPPRKGHSGAPGQAKGNVIAHRIEGRMKAERSRQEGKLAHFGNETFRPGKLPDEGGVDVTDAIGRDRKIGHQCGWVKGDPGHGEWGYCGKPTVNGTEWCEEHHARVYAGRAPL